MARFSGPRLTADAVMASACLPLVFKAVEIGGDAYWDGCYSGNPPLYPLIYAAQSSDILRVQINPVEHLRVPATVAEITDRVNEITFNAGLLAELRSIEFARRLRDEGKLDMSASPDVRLHHIDGGLRWPTLVQPARCAPTWLSCASCLPWAALWASNGCKRTARMWACAPVSMGAIQRVTPLF